MSDPIEAEAVARAALRDDDLPVVRLEGEAQKVKLLVDHREDLVAELASLDGPLSRSRVSSWSASEN